MRCFRSVNGSFEAPNGVAFAGDEAPDISSVMYVAHIMRPLDVFLNAVFQYRRHFYW
jgi:hypothetical protein